MQHALILFENGHSFFFVRNVTIYLNMVYVEQDLDDEWSFYILNYFFYPFMVEFVANPDNLSF